jgi:hypothetical protein
MPMIVILEVKQALRGIERQTPSNILLGSKENLSYIFNRTNKGSFALIAKTY